jgi:hypothetical protein
VNDGVLAGQTVLHAHVHVIPRVSGDSDDPRGGIRWAAFPEVKGFSPGNVWRMRAFYLAYQPDRANLAQPARESREAENSLDPTLVGASNLAQAAREHPPEPMSLIPWFHNVVIVEKIKEPMERRWYAAKTREHGWSRAILTVQIESNLYGREGGAVTNFARAIQG